MGLSRVQASQIVVVLSLFVAVTILAWLADAALTERMLTIAVSPLIVPAGSSLRVTCRVVRDPANRWLDMGVVDYRVSGEQLDGASALVTHEMTIAHVPCEAAVAFCRLGAPRSALATMTFEVAGCP
jgi:hypothetical protein